MESIIMKSKRRVFIDMDGVLCEYKEDATPEDMLKEGYFYNLCPRKSMVDALNYLIQSKEAEVFILSAVLPQIEKQAKNEKNAWLNEHMPAIDSEHRIFTLCGTDKAAAISGFNNSDILCDDYTTNLNLWSQAGGRAIKILNEVNGKNGSFTLGPRLNIQNKEDLFNTIKKLA